MSEAFEITVARKINQLKTELERLTASQGKQIPSAIYQTTMDLSSGWFQFIPTLTYASASTFTVAGNYTNVFETGVKLKLNNTTVKYFYVVSSSYSAPNTTVTVTAGSDFSLATPAAITNVYFSRGDRPEGFVDWFNYTPTWTATGGTPSIGDGQLRARFKIRGRSLLFRMYLEFGSTTSVGTTTAWLWSIPVAHVNYGVTLNSLGLVYIRNTGTANYIRELIVGAGSTTIGTMVDNGTNIGSLSYNYPFTWTQFRNLSIQAEYEI